jgi:hypothetical protein
MSILRIFKLLSNNDNEVTYTEEGSKVSIDAELTSSTLNNNGEKAVRVVITDPTIADAPGPTDINLSNISILESASIGATVGNLTAIGGLGPYTFTITDDPDNKFAISGNDLTIDNALDFDVADEHNVTIQVEDANNKITTKSFLITVIEDVAAEDYLVRFNGIDERSQAPNITEIDANASFTILFTITPRNSSKRQSIFSSQSQFANKRGFEIFLNSSGQLVVSFIDTNNSSTEISKRTNSSLTLNDKIFVAIKYDGSKDASGFSIELNDNFTGQTIVNNSGSNFATSGPFYVGARSDNGSHLQADINNIAIFNTVLSSSDITTFYNSGTPLEDISSIPSLLSPNIVHIPITNVDTYPTLTDLRGNYDLTLNANMSQSNILEDI